MFRTYISLVILYGGLTSSFCFGSSAYAQSSLNLNSSSLVNGNLLPTTTFAVALGLLLFSGTFFAIAYVKVKQMRQIVQDDHLTEQNTFQEQNYFEAIFKAQQETCIIWPNGDLNATPFSLGRVSSGWQDHNGEISLDKIYNDLDKADVVRMKSNISLLLTTGTSFKDSLTTHTGDQYHLHGFVALSSLVFKFTQLSPETSLEQIKPEPPSESFDIDIAQSIVSGFTTPAWIVTSDFNVLTGNKAYYSFMDENKQETPEKLIPRSQFKIALAALNAEQSDENPRKINEPFEIIVANDDAPEKIYAVHMLESLSTESYYCCHQVEQKVITKSIPSSTRTIIEDLSDESLWYEVLDKLDIPMAIFDKTQHLSYKNPSFQELWHLEEDWLNTSPSEKEVLDHLREQDLLPPEIEYRLWRDQQLGQHSMDADGSELPLWYLPNGKTLKFNRYVYENNVSYWVFEDVTESLTQQILYNELIDVQRETLNHLSEGIIVFGQNGRARLWNPSFVDIWGILKKTMDTLPHIDLIGSQVLFEDKNGELIWAKLKQTFVTVNETRKSISEHVQRNDGRILDYQCLPLPNGDAMFTFMDVTDSANIARVLEERNEALIDADRVKDRFVKHISYELRTPLSSVIGFAELLANDKLGRLNEKQAEYVDNIHLSSSSLLAIINDIINLASIDAGEVILNYTDVVVRQVITEAIVGLKDRIRDRGITIDLNIDDDLTFKADAKHLRHIVFNLLSNAIKFSNHGGTVNINGHQEDQFIELAVTNHGRGIAEDEIERIFDRFESADSSNYGGGAGLGLSLVKKYIELMQGEVDVTSFENQTTTFTCKLPIDPDLTSFEATANEAELLRAISHEMRSKDRESVTLNDKENESQVS